MTAEEINVFVKATVSTFDMMCDVTARRSGKLQVKQWIKTDHNLICMIGISGTVRGAVLITLKPEIGFELASRFLGEEVTEMGELMDSISELINIIVGAAAADLGGVDLSLPTPVIGNGHEIYTKHDCPWVMIPMEIKDMGSFNIEIAIEERK